MGSYVHQRDILLGKTNILKKTYIKKMHEKVTNDKHVTGLNFERQKTMDDFRHVESSFKRKYKKYLNGDGTKNVHKLDVQSDDEDHIQSSLPPLRRTRRRKTVRNVEPEIETKNIPGETVLNWNDIVKSNRSKSDLSRELSYLQSTLNQLPTSAENSFSSGSPRQISPERQLASVRMSASIKKTKQSPRLDTPAVAKRDTELISENSLVNPLTVLPNIASKSLEPEDGSPKTESSRHVQFQDADDDILPIRPRARRNTLETGMLSKHRKRLNKNTQIPAIAEEPLDIGMPRIQRSKSFGDIDKLRENQYLTKATLRLMADHSQGAKKFKYVGKLAELGMKDFKSSVSDDIDNDIDYSELQGCRYLRIPGEVINNEETSQGKEDDIKKSVKFQDHVNSKSP